MEILLKIQIFFKKDKNLNPKRTIRPILNTKKKKN